MIRGLVLIVVLLVTGLDFDAPTIDPPANHHARPRREICPGALYFYADWAPKPAWARDMRVVCHIGQHIFLAPRARHHDRGHGAAKD